MIYKWKYQTPSGFDDIIMSSDGEYLIGLWFEGSNDEKKHNNNCQSKYLKIFKETTKWLDIYFSGKIPNFIPKYKINGLTSFRKKVIDIMNNIPYGEIITYKDIALSISDNMSSQAVGGAVGWNPICIIIPCHRVIGSNSNLIGYGGGINNKQELLKLEGHSIEDGCVKDDFKEM